jgi:hypothetical protein
VVNEKYIRKDVEGAAMAQIEVLSRYFLERAKQNS